MEKINKVFCIGLNKTGTSSIHSALEILGFQSVHYRTKEYKKNIKDIIKENYDHNRDILKGLEHFDAFSDWNHPNTNNLFKEFDKQYPNSKFILNTRNIDDWMNSRINHIKRTPNLKKRQKENPGNTWLMMDKDIWTKEYNDHHHDVEEYFKNRPEDLLIFDITKGDGWEELCPFLNKDVPNIEFPRSNRASDQSRKLKYYNIGKKILKRFTSIFS